MKRFSFVLVLALVVLVFSACNQCAYETTTTVQGIVTSMEQTETTIVKEPHRNIFGAIRIIPRTILGYNHVVISYGALSVTVNSLALYNNVQIGGIVEVTLHQYFNSKNEVIKESIEYLG